MRPVSKKPTALLDIPRNATRTGRQRVADALVFTMRPEDARQETYIWKEYVNSKTGRKYDYHHHDPTKPQRIPCDGTDEGCSNPNHMAEKAFVYTDGPKYALVKGGEGGGKSVAGIIKTLERLRRGMHGIMVSPDFEHFKRSLWAEFRLWCPVDAVIPKDRYKLRPEWEPSKGFELHFINEIPGAPPTTLYVGGMDDPMSWEGPNVCFAHGDEVRRKENYQILKVLAGRVRIRGPKGERPQLWFTTTPKKHWLFDWFGGVPDHLGRLDEGAKHFSQYDPPDKKAKFKAKAVCLSLFTQDNEAFLDEDYVADRAAAIETEAERRVLLEAAWEDVADVSHYLDSHQQLDACEDHDLMPLGRFEAVVGAVDGAYAAKGDAFAMALAGQHPSKDRPDTTAIRKVYLWEALGNQQRDFDQIMDDIKVACLDHAVVELFYDPRELHHMMTLLRTPSRTKGGRRFPGVATTEFPQLTMREQADKAQLDKIRARRFAFGPESSKLKEHFHNADKKTTDDGRHCRIVKRHRDEKIDIAVVCSMASFKSDNIVTQPPPPTSESSGPFKSTSRRIHA